MTRCLSGLSKTIFVKYLAQCLAHSGCSKTDALGDAIISNASIITPLGVKRGFFHIK